jgi:hypothetical protein
LDPAKEEVSDVMLYGYRQGSEVGSPLRLREVTIAADAASIRRIARFLQFAADQLEKFGYRFGHEHLCDFDRSLGNAPSLVVTRLRRRRPKTSAGGQMRLQKAQKSRVKPKPE